MLAPTTVLATITLYLPHDPRPKWIDQKNYHPFWQAQLNEIILPSLPTSGSEVRLAGTLHWDCQDRRRYDVSSARE